VAARVVNPADRTIRTRLRETVIFPHLTERRALRLDAIQHYTARAHFGPWHRILGTPDFEHQTGVFSPLAYVEVESRDRPCDPSEKLLVTGYSHLARTLDEHGDTRHLVRDGVHELTTLAGTPVARARLVNVFTRYDPDPRRRRVTELPPEFGLGRLPSRVTEVPDAATLLPGGREPDFAEQGAHVWHYGQTDPNRHVNGVEYLRTLEGYLADVLQRYGQDLGRLWACKARIVYRKPCFRGEGYRRVAWFRGEAPLVVCGAVMKADDAPGARPAALVELTYRLHEDP
jgi:hypothetical protein